MDKLIEIVAQNIHILRKARDLEFRDFDLPDRLTSNFVRMVEKGTSDLSISKLQVIAQVLRVQPWELLTTEVQHRVIKEGKLQEVVENYLTASEEGRQLIEMVAERESQR